MKYKKAQWIGMIAGMALPLLPAYAQDGAPAASPASTNVVVAPVNVSHSVSEVLKLAQSGVGDDVILAYVKNSTSTFNLSANDIVALKDNGISSAVLAAMLSHDTDLKKQVAQSPSPAQTPAGQYTYDQKLYGSEGQQPAQPAPQPAAAQPAAAPAPVAAQPAPAPAPQTVVVQSAPPPAQVEVIPVSPGPDYYWTPGYWSWRGGAYVWIGGSYAYRPRPGAVYVNGYWGHHGHGYVWVGGHWR
jgi:WXXGXW repeat (2 copies)